MARENASDATILIQCPACGCATNMFKDQIGDAQVMKCGACHTSLGHLAGSAKAAHLVHARAKALSRPSRGSALADRRREVMRGLGLSW